MKTINCIKALEKWKRAKPYRCWSITAAFDQSFGARLVDLGKDRVDKAIRRSTLNAALNAAVKYLTEETK